MDRADFFLGVILLGVLLIAAGLWLWLGPAAVLVFVGVVLVLFGMGGLAWTRKQ